MTESSFSLSSAICRNGRWTAPTLALLALAACNSASSPEPRNVPEGTYDSTGSGANQQFFFVDTSFGGESNAIRVERQFYGRLVDVAAEWTDGNDERQRRVVHRDFVIDPRSDANWIAPYTLETNPITGAQTLVIEADFTDLQPNGGRAQFVSLLFSAASGTRPVADNGFVGTGTYTVIPRNAAFVIELDDLINPSSINGASVRVLSGVPAIIPETARIIADPNFGDLADFDGQGGLEFYSTRLIIDPTISTEESFQQDPPLTVDNIGLPASDDVTFANIQVRIATQSTPQTQQLLLLQNPTGGTVTTASNGTFDFGSSTLDIVRAFRSGGPTEVTGDPDNGFLPDATPPKIVGSLSTEISQPMSTTDPLVFVIPEIRFNSIACAQDPRIGDRLQLEEVFAEVLSNGTAINGVAMDITVRLVAFPPDYNPGQFAISGAGPAQYLVEYLAAEDLDQAPCFVSLSPPVTDSAFPDQGVSPLSSFSVTFNEPIDPGLFEPYESLRLLREPPPADPSAFIPRGNFIPGQVFASQSLRSFTFDPITALTHEQGAQEQYQFELPIGPRAAVDLAGNMLPAVDTLPVITFNLEPTAPASITGGRVTKFDSKDEELPFADQTADAILDRKDKPEWFGQIVFDEARGRIRPRPVVRSQLVCSDSATLPGAMIAGGGTSIPLNPLGARTQILWRYCDFADLPLTRNDSITEDHDYTQLNLDIEAVSLSPLGGNPVFESYDEFQISMAHSLYLPDETIDPMTGALVYAGSGIQSTFALNLLDPTNDPFRIVHPRASGYTINPGDQTLANDMTPLLPLPINRGVEEDAKRFYTWRDTGLQTRGGPNGQGAPPGSIAQQGGQIRLLPGMDMMGAPDCTMPVALHPFYPPDLVRSAALPLLLDIRCYPTGSISTTNVFADRLAHPSTLPGFRAFSSGGRDQSGSQIIVDPDSETIANGGFDPTSMPPGAPIGGLDNTLYFGAVDFVVRVSRTHSVFYPALDPTSAVDDEFTAPSYAEPAVFPTTQPLGTLVELEFRGATLVPDTGPSSRALDDASFTGAYGDYWSDSKPIAYIAPVEDTTIEFQGGASCVDGSFGFPSTFFDFTLAEQNPGIAFLDGDDRWKSAISEIDRSRFFQVRITMTSNAATGLTPEVSSLGFAWSE
ncbi:MAG: Ig-like domain-containing protein [Planctomycetota bacterium]